MLWQSLPDNPKITLGVTHERAGREWMGGDEPGMEGIAPMDVIRRFLVVCKPIEKTSSASASADIVILILLGFSPADFVFTLALRFAGTKTSEEKKRTQADNNQAAKYDLVPAHQLRLRSLASSRSISRYNQISG
jgi:hypothetical protein